MPRLLKVFQAHLGFYDTVVAAPSRAAALKAWGSRQNLFRDGSAKETEDPHATAVARAKPGIVLRRPAGSRTPFTENPGLPKLPSLPKKPVTAKEATSAAVREVARPKLRVVPPSLPRKPPDRGPIEHAEKALTALKHEEERALARIKARKAALDEEERKLRDDYHTRRLAAERVLIDARRAFQNALKRG
jgi:hypothetical protein